MRKNFTAAIVSATIFLILPYADASTQDTNAVIDINGVVSESSTACEVTLSKSVMNLSSEIGALPEQGEKASSLTLLSMEVAGVNNNDSCSKKIYDGQIAVRFVGIYDDADGTSFANTATGENAATGVGIGIFEMNNTPVDARSVYNIRDKTNFSVNYLGFQLTKLKNHTVSAGEVSGNITFQIERL